MRSQMIGLGDVVGVGPSASPNSHGPRTLYLDDFEAAFNSHDYDCSETINTREELLQMTMNMYFKSGLQQLQQIDPQSIEAHVDQLFKEEGQVKWALEQYAQWFARVFGVTVIGLPDSEELPLLPDVKEEHDDVFETGIYRPQHGWDLKDGEEDDFDLAVWRCFNTNDRDLSGTLNNEYELLFVTLDVVCCFLLLLVF